MKIEWKYGDRVLNLPGKCSAILPEATLPMLRVLLALAADENETTLGARTGLSEPEIEEALRALSEREIFRSEGVRADDAHRAGCDRPAYTGEDMERICAKREVPELIDVCAAILGKTFTPTETESILYLYDGLRLEFSYIVRLCKFCADIGKPSLRYMEKVAVSLYDSGVSTTGALDAYIEKETRKHDMEYQIRRLFGIGERALTPKEQEYLTSWVIDWGFPFEVIELAYNKMMGQVAHPKFSYENGILKKWADAGCRTPEEIERFDASHEKSGKTKSGTKEKKIGFDLDEFFAAATLRGEESENSSGKKGT